MSSATGPSKALLLAVAEASQWYALLTDPDVTEQEHFHWQAWLQASEYNQQAWQQMLAVSQQCQDLPCQIAGPTLVRSQFSRRKLLQTMLSVAVLSPALWLFYRYQQSLRYQAQYKTAIGEIRNVTLADGSQLTLNTDTALDVTFTEQARLVTLYAGEVFISTSKDYRGSAPFVLTTQHGRIKALGTEFSVRVYDKHTQVQVARDQVQVNTRHQSNKQLVSAGEKITFNAEHTSAKSTFSNERLSWIDRSLVVVNEPLKDLITELSRYRRGVLSCSEDVAEIKVSGAYPLMNTDVSLAVLSESFPIKIQQFSPYWVRVVSSK